MNGNTVRKSIIRIRKKQASILSLNNERKGSVNWNDCLQNCWWK